MRLKKRLQYSAEARWDHKTGGTAQMGEFKQRFDTPQEFDGRETAPCPDQLFMASLAGCIINTFNYYRMMLDVETIDFTVKVSSTIELTKLEGYRIKEIDVEINVWSDEENLELNKKCATRAKEYCHITKSIEPAIPIRSMINLHLVDRVNESAS